jgi:hypothetical protein
VLAARQRFAVHVERHLVALEDAHRAHLADVHGADRLGLAIALRCDRFGGYVVVVKAQLAHANEDSVAHGVLCFQLEA